MSWNHPAKYKQKWLAFTLAKAKWKNFPDFYLFQAWDRSSAKKEEKPQKGRKISYTCVQGWKSENGEIPLKEEKIPSLYSF